MPSPRSRAGSGPRPGRSAYRSCAHDLLGIAAEFGNTAVDNLRNVLACYEAMRASDALTT